MRAAWHRTAQRAALSAVHVPSGPFVNTPVCRPRFKYARPSGPPTRRPVWMGSLSMTSNAFSRANACVGSSKRATYGIGGPHEEVPACRPGPRPSRRPQAGLRASRSARLQPPAVGHSVRADGPNRMRSTPSVSVPAHSEPSASSNIERTCSEIPSTRPSSTQRPRSYLNEARPSRNPIQTRDGSTAETFRPYELNDKSFGVLMGTAVVPVNLVEAFVARREQRRAGATLERHLREAPALAGGAALDGEDAGSPGSEPGRGRGNEFRSAGPSTAGLRDGSRQRSRRRGRPRDRRTRRARGFRRAPRPHRAPATGRLRHPASCNRRRRIGRPAARFTRATRLPCRSTMPMPALVVARANVPSGRSVPR